jgi:hypothetical protein
MIQLVKLNELKKPAKGKMRIFGICCYAEKLLNSGDRRENIAADDVPAGKNATVIVDF